MIILNERVFAEKCIDTYSYGDNIYETLQILAKYYYTEGLRAKRIEKKLIEFLQENYQRYQSNITRWQETAEKLSRKAGKYPLYENNEILITKDELSVIDNIEEPNGKTDLRRIAFTLLCLAKLYNARNVNNNGWVNTDAKDIFKMAHVSVSKKRQFQIFGDLQILGLIDSVDSFPAKIQ